MTDRDVKHMNKAIGLAETCKPIEGRIPKVGAIIVAEGKVIGKGIRGSGEPGDDDHAEKNALASVSDTKLLSGASVYTTLEPCIQSVRSVGSDCCSELLCRARVRKVFVGILDPNQAVTGKGLWTLQDRGMEVELFPHKLAMRIRSLNAEFIKEQQTLGIEIKNLKDGQSVRTGPDRGFTLRGSYVNAPGPDVFVLTRIGINWWAQPNPLTMNRNKTWSTKIYLDSVEPHDIFIVRADELGSALIAYYRTATTLLKPDFPAIAMTRLSKGLEPLAKVEGLKILS